jgi:hypothetical protein
VGFLLSLQAMGEDRDDQRREQLVSSYSLTICISTTSTTIC